MTLFPEDEADRVLNLSRLLRVECQEMRETTDRMSRSFDAALRLLLQTRGDLRCLAKPPEDTDGSHDASVAP